MAALDSGWEAGDPPREGEGFHRDGLVSGRRKPAGRAKVTRAIFVMSGRNSALGTYAVDRNGDTTLRRYGIYKIAHGQLSMWREAGRM